jgi:hypothetical protein
LGIKFKPLKYQQYSSVLNSLPALNSVEIHHFWTDTTECRFWRDTWRSAHLCAAELRFAPPEGLP